MTVAGALGAVVAHQGGWDELLFVATPVLLFAVLLWVAKRRAEREQDDAVGEAAPEPPTDPPAPDASRSTP